LERQAIEVSRSNVDEAFNEKRYQDAQEMSTLADAAKAVLDEKDAVFEIVRRCLKDARACVTMERSAKAFVLAGAWQDIAEKLAHRLESFGASKAAGDGLFSPPKRAPPVVEISDLEAGAAADEGGGGEVEVELLEDPAAHEAARARKLISYTLTKGQERVGKGIGHTVRSKPMTQSEFNAKYNNPYTWRGCVHPNYHASTFFLDQGMTMCRGCGTGVSREGWAQHVHGRRPNVPVSAGPPRCHRL